MKIEVNGTTIFYEEYSAGPPLLLLHGCGEDGQIFDKSIPALAERYRVIAIDSRGHGQSAPLKKGEALHYDDMAEDVKSLADALELKKPVLCGFSDGGIVGLLLEIKYPELLGRLVACGANITPAGLKLWALAMLRMLYILTRKAMLKMAVTEPHITQEELSAIKTPCLILAGEKDMIREAETRRIAAAIPNAELMILKGEDHGSYVVHSEKLADIVLEYLMPAG
jgi:pimeloyl-ACP methyl ester carboxylesterase